jgi:hypothetical protein
MSSVSFATDCDLPYVDWALSTAARFTGIRIHHVAETERPDVWYGSSPRECRLHVPRTERFHPDDATLEAAGGTGGRFPFDVFSALRYWLSDEPHAHAPRDVHDRLPADRSLQATRGEGDRAIVNAYLLALRTAITAATGATPEPWLPHGARCGVVLSHDVDNPIANGSFALRAGVATRLIRQRRWEAAARSIRDLSSALGTRLRHPSDRFWLFDDVMRQEDRRGFRSTFFFAARSRYDPDGAAIDVDYTIASPPLRAVMQQLNDQGWEVGLHESYTCAEDTRRIGEERALLEHELGSAIDGGRHHYWHLGPDPWRTLRGHADAGLKYDSSVAFNDAPGYRFAAAFPFRPWDPTRDAPIPVVQIPVAAMDSAFFRAPGASAADAIRRLREVLAELKRSEGVAAIDWHDYTSYPASRALRPWGEAYIALLDELASDSEIAVLTCREAAGLLADELYDPRP